MYVSLLIEEDHNSDEEEHNYANISQTLAPLTEDDIFLFATTTDMQACFPGPTRWHCVLDSVIIAIEKHFGYSVRDKLHELQR
jgi:hypothetical protein